MRGETYMLQKRIRDDLWDAIQYRFVKTPEKTGRFAVIPREVAIWLISDKQGGNWKATTQSDNARDIDGNIVELADISSAEDIKIMDVIEWFAAADPAYITEV